MKQRAILFLTVILLVSLPGAQSRATFNQGEERLSTDKSVMSPTAGIWYSLPDGPNWSDAGGWDRPQYYSTIQTGDIDGDGHDELLARSASGIETWGFDPTSNLWSKLPDGPGWSDAGGWDHPQYYSTIQTGDVDGDSRDELLARNAAGIEVWAFDVNGNTWSQLPNGPSWSDAGNWDEPQYYSTIQTADIDLDFRDELLARSAVGIEAWDYDPVSKIWSQLGNGPSWSDAEGWDQPQYYSTIQLGVIRGFSEQVLVARSDVGIRAWLFYPASDAWAQMMFGPGWSDTGGWNQPQYYSTIQTGDIDGDHRDELLARNATGIEVWGFDRSIDNWSQFPNGPAWSDAAGWDQEKYYSTIQTGDLNGDLKEELLARNAAGLEVRSFNPASNTWSQLPNGPNWSDAAGWDRKEYYSTIQTGDIDGDGQDELLARSGDGILAWGFDYEILGLSASNDSPTHLGEMTGFKATVTSGSDISYEWDFGDGNSGVGLITSHTFASAGTYTATVTASNPISSDTATTTVTVEANIFLPMVLK